MLSDPMRFGPTLGHAIARASSPCDASSLPVQRGQAEELSGLIGEAVHLGSETTTRVWSGSLRPGRDLDGRTRGSCRASMANANSIEGVVVDDLDVGSRLSAADSGGVHWNDDDADRSRGN